MSNPSPATPPTKSAAAKKPAAKADKPKADKPKAAAAPKPASSRTKAEKAPAAPKVAKEAKATKKEAPVAKSAPSVGKSKAAPSANGKKRHNRVVRVSLDQLPFLVSNQRVRLFAAAYKVDRFQGDTYDEDGKLVEAGPLRLAKISVTETLYRIGTLACLLARSRGVKRPRAIDVARAYKIVTGLTLYLSHDDFAGVDDEADNHKRNVSRANRSIHKARRERLATMVQM